MDIISIIGVNPADLVNPATYAEYTFAIIVFFATFLIIKIVKSVLVVTLRKFADKTANKLDDTIVDIIEGFGVLFYIVTAIFLASQFLPKLPVFIVDVITNMMMITLVIYAVKSINKLVDYGTRVLINVRKKEEGENEDVSIIRLMNRIGKLFIWIGAGLVYLANAGMDISALIAGFGVSGIAIAFALQNILGDIFASFSIYFDKPFKVGDYIAIGKDSGVVQKIGIKSTRLQTLQGEELIVSNRELTSTRINNYKKLKRRRVVFAIGVTYQTSAKKLENIPRMIEKIMSKMKLAEYSRVHFKSFGDSALNYEIVYYVKTSDYDKFMDIQQEINLGIVKEFEKANIEFAYPTQTIFLEK